MKGGQIMKKLAMENMEKLGKFVPGEIGGRKTYGIETKGGKFNSFFSGMAAEFLNGPVFRKITENEVIIVIRKGSV